MSAILVRVGYFSLRWPLAQCGAMRRNWDWFIIRPPLLRCICIFLILCVPQWFSAYWPVMHRGNASQAGDFILIATTCTAPVATCERQSIQIWPMLRVSLIINSKISRVAPLISCLPSKDPHEIRPTLLKHTCGLCLQVSSTWGCCLKLGTAFIEHRAALPLSMHVLPSGLLLGLMFWHV